MRGIKFILDDIISFHTGNDLNLVQEIKTISTPSIQSYFVEVAGRNGLVDLTKSLTGDVNYNNRNITLKYFMSGSKEELNEIMEKFNMIHGETVKLIDDDSIGYYYQGNATVSFELKNNYGFINVEINALPFKYALFDVVKQITLTSSYSTYKIFNTGNSTNITFEVVGMGRIKKGDLIKTVQNGVQTFEDIKLEKGLNVFEFAGNGRIIIKYKEVKI